jgi:hypothetical protein
LEQGNEVKIYWPLLYGGLVAFSQEINLEFLHHLERFGGILPSDGKMDCLENRQWEENPYREDPWVGVDEDYRILEEVRTILARKDIFSL